MYNATDLVYTEFLEDFNHYVSSFLLYRYTTNYSDIPLIGDKIYKRYFSDGKLRDPLNAVKVSTYWINNGWKTIKINVFKRYYNYLQRQSFLLVKNTVCVIYCLRSYINNSLIIITCFRHKVLWNKLISNIKCFKMISGGLILHGVFQMATKLSQPVYYYIYDYFNKFSFNSLYGPYPYPKKLGVTHADEVTSLFYTAGRADLQGKDLDVSNLMVNIWTRFATTEYVILFIDFSVDKKLRA